jgi:Tfp pilus assembly protein PilO
MVDEIFYYIYAVSIIICLLIVSIVVIYALISRMKRHMADMQIREALHRREETIRYQQLLGQLKKNDSKSAALNNLQILFDDKVNFVRQQYPQLTDLDIQVLMLIGLGVSNHEILLITDMSKRTYYKRRQLIAQRMNTTASQLDQTAQQLLTKNNKL